LNGASFAGNNILFRILTVYYLHILFLDREDREYNACVQITINIHRFCFCFVG